MKIHRGNFESNLLFIESVPFLQTSKRILEIGSGRGALVHALKEKGHEVTGTEINAEYTQYAKQEYGVDLVSINAESPELPFPENSFDVVMSFDVFEHIPDTASHLKEVARVLAPEGKYLFGTPNKLTNIPFEIIKEKSFTKYKEYHCSLHTYRGLKKRLQQAGFRGEFIQIPIVTPFFREKMGKHFGFLGPILIKVFQPDSWPKWLKTNFYVVATKISQK